MTGHEKLRLVTCLLVVAVGIYLFIDGAAWNRVLSVVQIVAGLWLFAETLQGARRRSGTPIAPPLIEDRLLTPRG
ncbi:hypothetical protein [Brevibacterium luteolum]|uniref:hypothetical protein n=1 Tax=Brevibacterium luteolum TaxID=199591 RepID=UPI00223BAB81|nr:hypothetical protein [Brevibacterium luteolum]MCT1872960.1 hypothetical protein [Brevibacterium luteolum]MCT1892832.1 hypothetical protein [Brevibacterium luteolum]